MKTVSTIDLADARRVAAAAEGEAVKNGWEVVIAILDAGGHLVYLQRADGAQLGSVEVAQQKARTALYFRWPSKALEHTVVDGRLGYLSMANVLPVEGGLPLEAGGQVVGAIGISGAKSHEDGQIAAAGAVVLSGTS